MRGKWAVIENIVTIRAITATIIGVYAFGGGGVAVPPCSGPFLDYPPTRSS
jgi:hypothetical protein